MTDHKYQIQREAEEIADDLGFVFHQLPSHRQAFIYALAERRVTERMADAADTMCDSKEGK
jgi:hypothetical protein